MADGDMLAVMVFALLLGIGLAAAPGEPARRLEEVLRGLYDVTMRLLGLVIRLAPFGVACLLFALADAARARDASARSRAYVGVVLLGARAPAVRGLLGVGRVARRHVAARASSAACAPRWSPRSRPPRATPRCRPRCWVAEDELQLPPHVSRFVLTLGSTANQNGTALFEGVTVLFLAQFYGVELSLGAAAHGRRSSASSAASAPRACRPARSR